MVKFYLAEEACKVFEERIAAILDNTIARLQVGMSAVLQ